MLIMRGLHVLCSMWFVSGLLGRTVAYAQARRASDVRTAAALLGLSHRFERWMVIPGSQALLVFGLLTAWLQGRPRLGLSAGPHAAWLLVSLLLFVGVTPIFIAVLAPRGKRRARALTAALAHGAMTPDLRAALTDRTVLSTRAAELLVAGVIVVLMIFKPF